MVANRVSLATWSDGEDPAITSTRLMSTKARARSIWRKSCAKRRPVSSVEREERKSTDDPPEGIARDRTTPDQRHQKQQDPIGKRVMPEIEIELYDAELFAAQTDEPEGDWISAVESDRSDREPARQKVLAEIQKHRLGNKRKLAVGSQKMVDRIAGLAAAAPHFRETLGLIRRAVLLSMRTSVQLSVPPLLLVSEPGLGKTWLARRLAEAIGVPMGEYSFASGDDPGVLTGHSLSWRGARAGLVARTLLFGDFASPVIFIDEVDKSMSLHGEDPTDCLNALLEPENARRYTDQFVELPVRADHVIWILTANNIDGLRPSLIDRTLVMRVGRPTDDEQVRVLRSIVDEALAPYADVGPTVSDEALRGLSACSPRLAKKIVVLAFAYAAADNRLEISADDIESARRIAGGHGGRRPVGFNAF